MLDKNYTAEEDRAFWALFISANIWIASGTGPFGKLAALPYLALCFVIRYQGLKRLFRA